MSKKNDKIEEDDLSEDQLRKLLDNVSIGASKMNDTQFQ